MLNFYANKLVFYNWVYSFDIILIVEDEEMLLLDPRCG